jgi:hypothetical protein
MNTVIRASALIAAFTAAPLAAQQVTVQAGGDAATHAVASSYEKVRLLVTGPNGLVSEQVRSGAGNNSFSIDTRLLPDGYYNYRFDFQTATATRPGSTHSPSNEDGRAVTSALPGGIAPAPSGGGFLLRGGQVIFPRANSADGDQDVPGKTAAPRPKDQVIPDDLIVQFSACVGTDCVNGESFGFDTIRLKENNTRIKFEDTSAAGFPAVDWQLTANDSAAGGQDKFSIEDITGSRVPLTIEGGATTDSVYVDSTGRIGFRTATPVLDLHVNTSNSPAIRLEQNANGGFTAQTWDVSGNEANFFIRDVTGGSRLSFRIRPGAPTSSIDIAGNGDVGFGTASPQARVNASKAVDINAPEPMLRVTNQNFGTDANLQPEDHRFEVDSNGNVNARGTISQLSSRTAKEGFEPIDRAELLARVAGLPVGTWRYIAAPDRHLGPVAEDFHQAFGLGSTDKMIAPSDLAGVALAAVQALQQEVQQRDQQIEALERRLADLEARSAH